MKPDRRDLATDSLEIQGTVPLQIPLSLGIGVQMRIFVALMSLIWISTASAAPQLRPAIPERCYSLLGWQSQPTSLLLCITQNGPQSDDSKPHILTLRDQGSSQLIATLRFELIFSDESRYLNTDTFDSTLPALTNVMRIKFNGLRRYDRSETCISDKGTVYIGETPYNYELVPTLPIPKI